MGVQSLNTRRLRLEPLVFAHADALFELYQDPELYPYIRLDPPKSIDIFRDRIQLLEGRLSRDGSEWWLNWVAYDLQSSEIVGKIEVSLHRESKRALLAYTVFRRHWRKGYAQEACKAVIRHCFEQWETKRVVMETDTRNQASIALAESLGATRVGFKPKAEYFKGAWSDEFSYELLPQRSLMAESPRESGV